MNELRIEYLPLDQLAPYARNARTHTPAQIAKIRASMAEFGWTNPILHAEGQIIAGHGRLQAAIEMRRDGQAIKFHRDPNEAPTVDLSHLDEQQRRAYVLADNRIAEDSGWDPDLLRAELAGLMAADLQLEVTGFDLEQIREAIFPKNQEERSAARSKGSVGDHLNYQIVIECEDEMGQADLLGELQERGVKCRPLIL